MFSGFPSFFQKIFNIFLVEKTKKTLYFKECFLDRTSHYEKQLETCALDKIYVGYFYDEEIKNQLERFKYQYNPSIKNTLIPLYVQIFAHFQIETDSVDLILTGIPMFFFQKIKRGYNHGYLLARGISKETGFLFFPFLKKTKWTEHQARLSAKDRKKNLIDVFVLDKKTKNHLQNKTIIIIDDVISTGSTANEAAKVLKKEGATRVIGVFLASQKIESTKNHTEKELA